MLAVFPSNRTLRSLPLTHGSASTAPHRIASNRIAINFKSITCNWESQCWNSYSFIHFRLSFFYDFDFQQVFFLSLSVPLRAFILVERFHLHSTVSIKATLALMILNLLVLAFSVLPPRSPFRFVDLKIALTQSNHITFLLPLTFFFLRRPSSTKVIAFHSLAHWNFLASAISLARVEGYAMPYHRYLII